ncbi:hypothetical protein PCANC_06855 [Puccinia coronata f. sp. avenae]|uniref:Uncharacterized protein n=1 Tax=Puccinia coronata f. sp. avenae TaxID=200324 RepID=A0A2N5VVK5_9BASI|nr:hypothetical protein PCANC_06855 [Puccinia coronata f. sp. avenae]
MDPASRASHPFPQGQQCRPPLPTGSPSVPSRLVRRPLPARFRHCAPFGVLDPHLLSTSFGLHARPLTPTPSDHPERTPSTIHTRSFSYDDHFLSKDRTGGSSACTDLDDIIGRSMSSRCWVEPGGGSSPVANPLHQRSLSVPATPANRSPSRVRFANASEHAPEPHHHHHQSHRRVPSSSSPLVVATKPEEGCKADPGSSLRPLGESEKTMEDDDAVEGDRIEQAIRMKLSKKMEIDRLAHRRTTKLQDVFPISSSAASGGRGSHPVTNTGSAASPERHSALPAHPSHPAGNTVMSDHSVGPLAPSATRHRQPGRDPPSAQRPSSSTTGTSTPPARPPPLYCSADLPPQVYPGKLSPLLPPPLPAPRPTRQISFPRPFRRRLSVDLQPSTVQLPPSPPPEFDFTAFEHPAPQSNSSPFLYNLLDDSPCIPNFDSSPSHHQSEFPLIDLSNEREEPIDAGKSQQSAPEGRSTVAKPCNHFSPLPSPVISEEPFLSSILSSPPTECLPARHQHTLYGREQEENRNDSAIESGVAEIIQTSNENIPISPVQEAPPRFAQSPQSSQPSSPRPPSDCKQSLPTEQETDHSASSHTPRNESVCRGDSKLAGVPSSPTPATPLHQDHIASSHTSRSGSVCRGDSKQDGFPLSPTPATTLYQDHSASSHTPRNESACRGDSKLAGVPSSPTPATPFHQDHRASSHTPRNESACRGDSKLAEFPSSSTPGNGQEQPVAAPMDASLKRSHSRASSVHSLIYQSPVNKPTSKSLAEEALRLHLSKDQVLSGDTSVAPFQALVGGPDAMPSPQIADGRIDPSEAAKSKDDELASLVETINKRNKERSEMLSGLLRAVIHGIQEHDRKAEEETAMIRNLGRARRQLVDRLAGEVCGGSQFGSPFLSPSQTPRPSTHMRGSNPHTTSAAAVTSRHPSPAGTIKDVESIKVPSEIKYGLADKPFGAGQPTGESIGGGELASEPVGGEEPLEESIGGGEQEKTAMKKDDLSVEEQPINPISQSELTTLVGSLAGGIVGRGGTGEGSQIMVDDEEDDHKPTLRHPIHATSAKPLREWIRFGRAGFKFHILDAHPTHHKPAPHPEKLP